MTDELHRPIPPWKKAATYKPAGTPSLTNRMAGPAGKTPVLPAPSFPVFGAVEPIEGGCQTVLRTPGKGNHLLLGTHGRRRAMYT